MKTARFVMALAALVAPLSCETETVSMGFDSPVENRGTMPSGTVRTCYGNVCPYGDCDDDEIFSDVDCNDAYPGPVDDDALFCHPGESGEYCLIVGPDSFNEDYWLVKCSGTVATATRCGSGCEDRFGDVACL